MSAKVRYLKLATRKPAKPVGPVSEAFLRKFVSETTSLIEEGLHRDGVVRIHDFGTFERQWYKSRTGRDPRTGEPLTIPGHDRVVFRPAKKLQDRVNIEFAHLEPEFLPLPADEVTTPASPSPESVSPLPFDIVEEAGAGVPAGEPRPVPLSATAQEPLPPPATEEISTEGVVVGHIEETHAPWSGSDLEPPPPEPQKRAGKVKWYAGIVALLLLLLLIVWVDLSDNESPVRSQPATVTATQPHADETDGDAAAAKETSGNGKEMEPTFPGGTHEVVPGDNLWNLAGNYYYDPFLWPNIYRVNTETVKNPDILEPHQILALPIMYGTPDNLTEQDRRNLAEGYFNVYEFYRSDQPHLAPFALWAAVRFDPEILALHNDRISSDDLAFLNAHNVERVATK